MTTIQSNNTVAAPAGKYLTFFLSSESYGIPVTKIREIIRATNITPMPQMPPYVRGVINLRGKIIPVVDLCARLELRSNATAVAACVIVVQVNGTDRHPVQFGLLVDGVEEVRNFTPEQIEPAPEFCQAMNAAGIMGMTKTDDGVRTLLDIEQILTAASLPL